MRHINKGGSKSARLLGLTGLVLIGAAGPVGAEDGFRGPQSPAEHARMLTREADDVALLLGLRADQRPALDAFLQSQGPPPPPRDAQAGEHDMTSPPADGFAQHLQRMEEMTKRRSDDDAKRLASARSFYGSLDQRQRSAFEALMRVRRGPGGPGRPGGPDGPGFHGRGPGGPGGPGGRDDRGPGGAGPGGGADPTSGSPPRQ